MIHQLSVIIAWLLVSSFKASIVAAIIMIIRTVFSNKLPSKWLYFLWLLFVVRLVIPVDLPAPFSIFNMTEDVTTRTIPKRPIILEQQGQLDVTKKTIISESENQQSDEYAAPQITAIQTQFLFFDMAGIIWFAGVVVTLAITLIVNFQQRRKFQMATAIENETLISIFLKCKAKLDISKNIGLYEIPGIRSPYFYGIIHPRILFPSHILEVINRKEIEYIFMHELAHFKRNDLPVAFLSMILQTLHWFNPIIWYAFLVMRNDRETACDELVLHKLGKTESQSYGQTLISLLRLVKQEKLLPTALGLAGSRSNLKRRITMIANFSKLSKKWAVAAFLIIMSLSVVALTGAQKSATVSGTITTQNHATLDTIYVGIYDYNWDDNFYGSGGEPIRFATLTHENKFKFKLPAGMYTLVAWSLGYDNAQFKFFIEDDRSRIKFDLSLAPSGVFENISHVAVVGDFCGWDTFNAPQMQKIEGVWKIDKPDSLKIGQPYKYFVWDEWCSGPQDFLLNPTIKPIYRYSPNGKKMKVSKNWGTFDHIYQGEDLIFDPSLFVQPRKNVIIKTEGGNHMQQFNDLPHELYLWTLEMVRPINARNHSFDQKAHYYRMRNKLEDIEQKYDPYFEPFFVEQKLRLNQLFSPIRSDFFKSKNDSLKLTAFFESDTFKTYYQDLTNLVNKVHTDSWLWRGEFVYNLLHEIPGYLEKNPDLEKTYGISKTYCLNTLEEFAQNGINPACQQRVLYELMWRYEDMDSTALSEKYKKILLDKFPDGFYANAIKEQNAFKWEKVEPYVPPELQITTMNQGEIKLSDLKGKFVFIDFWATWCIPCRKEIPNIINLANSISKDTLQVIGVASDKEEDLRKYFKETPLPYPNGMGKNEIAKAWNVSGIPASFLINPKGEVIAKDFRGDGTTEKVRELIRNYYAE